jgi:very-short-patch-repair endonuclease
MVTFWQFGVLSRKKQTMDTMDLHAEIVLWNYLKNRRLGSYLFLKDQVLPCGFLAPFYCPEARLIVGVRIPDRHDHPRPLSECIERSMGVLTAGYAILRFHPQHVQGRIDFVLSQILEAARERSGHWRKCRLSLN